MVAFKNNLPPHSHLLNPYMVGLMVVDISSSIASPEGAVADPSAKILMCAPPNYYVIAETMLYAHIVSKKKLWVIKLSRGSTFVDLPATRLWIPLSTHFLSFMTRIYGLVVLELIYHVGIITYAIQNPRNKGALMQFYCYFCLGTQIKKHISFILPFFFNLNPSFDWI